MSHESRLHLTDRPSTFSCFPCPLTTTHGSRRRSPFACRCPASVPACRFVPLPSKSAPASRRSPTNCRCHRRVGSGCQARPGLPRRAARGSAPPAPARLPILHVGTCMRRQARGGATSHVYGTGYEGRPQHYTRLCLCLVKTIWQHRSSEAVRVILKPSVWTATAVTKITKKKNGQFAVRTRARRTASDPCRHSPAGGLRAHGYRLCSHPASISVSLSFSAAARSPGYSAINTRIPWLSRPLHPSPSPATLRLWPSAPARSIRLVGNGEAHRSLARQSVISPTFLSAPPAVLFGTSLRSFSISVWGGWVAHGSGGLRWMDNDLC